MKGLILNHSYTKELVNILQGAAIALDEVKELITHKILI